MAACVLPPSIRHKFGGGGDVSPSKVLQIAREAIAGPAKEYEDMCEEVRVCMCLWGW